MSTTEDLREFKARAYKVRVDYVGGAAIFIFAVTYAARDLERLPPEERTAGRLASA